MYGWVGGDDTLFLPALFRPFTCFFHNGFCLLRNVFFFLEFLFLYPSNFTLCVCVCHATPFPFLFPFVYSHVGIKMLLSSFSLSSSSFGIFICFFHVTLLQAPSRQPSGLPTLLPTTQPTDSPSNQPTNIPTTTPTTYPSSLPTPRPSQGNSNTHYTYCCCKKKKKTTEIYQDISQNVLFFFMEPSYHHLIYTSQVNPSLGLPPTLQFPLYCTLLYFIVLCLFKSYLCYLILVAFQFHFICLNITCCF